jgi:hypothetical protein
MGLAPSTQMTYGYGPPGAGRQAGHPHFSTPFTSSRTAAPVHLGYEPTLPGSACWLEPTDELFYVACIW